MPHSSIDIVAADGDTLLQSALSEISEKCGKAGPSADYLREAIAGGPSYGGAM